MARAKPSKGICRLPAIPARTSVFAPLLEGMGRLTQDPRGSRIGNFVGAPAWAVGPWGPELDYPIATQSGVAYGTFPNSTSLTVIAVAMPADNGVARSLVGKRSGSTGWQFFRSTSGSLSLRVSGTVISSTLSMPANQYRGAAVAFSGGESATFYLCSVGGITKQTVSTTAVISPGNEPLWLGAYEGGAIPNNPWVGRMVAALVVERALLESRVLEQMSDLWTGAYATLRPTSPSWLAGVQGGVVSGPTPRKPARWFPGLRR